MFTGIIQGMGEVKKTEGNSLMISSKLNKKYFKKGSSISVNGACLTVEAYKNGVFKASLGPETLKATNLGDLKIKDRVNLEAPLTLSTLISGHLVSGHIDFKTEVLEEAPAMKIKIPKKYLKYMPLKGSIVVNGVSLTIMTSAEVLELMIIPETMKSTNLSLLKNGDHVNIEVDLLAKYLEKLKS